MREEREIGEQLNKWSTRFQISGKLLINDVGDHLVSHPFTCMLRNIKVSTSSFHHKLTTNLKILVSHLRLSLNVKPQISLQKQCYVFSLQVGGA